MRRMVLFLALGLLAWLWVGPQIWADADEGIRVINALADDHEVDKADQGYDAIEPLVGGNDRAFGDALKNFGSEDGARQADREAALTRAKRLLPIKRQPIVAGSQNGPITFFPAHEPILVVIPESDMMCVGTRPAECSHADGIFKDGLPEEHNWKKTVLQVPGQWTGGQENALPGNLHAHLARICNGGACGEWVQTGFVYAVCGDGDEQQWTDAIAQKGQTLDRNGDFIGSTGGYTFEAFLDHPQATAACAANPGVDIVPNLKVRQTAPPEQLVAQK